MDDLKSLIMRSIEDKGVMSKLKAQIKASIFKILNQNSDDPLDQIHFDWENQKANRINKEQNLIIISRLIINLFQFLELDYSENIFKNEISL